MDTHIQGPRGGGYGAVLSAIIGYALHGTTVAGTKLLTSTYGAKPTNPLFVRISGHIKTAFNGTTPVFSLLEENLDGSGDATVAAIADFSSGKFSKYFFLTVDKKYSLVYTPNVSDTTAGEAYYAIEVCGPGQLP